MKEYVADTGGRYTYVDDILNLQELALSMTAIFRGCDDFIISGCEITGNAISPGYVWINGKIRYFEGCVTAAFLTISMRRTAPIQSFTRGREQERAQ
ncbi:hypothetical protein SFC43_13140 [Bacteroides sp. CR5/BHMF/2]|nr:hypothetical protein [Bacteroides sp. CR5/BHMF/2]